jgi:succinate dehydrogenase/fumarate reductase flavoprotein subunit
MAGLCAAVRARELGLRPILYEKGNRAGGSMLLSSCVVWRYRSLEDFRAECPGGNPTLQQLLIDRFDDALAWLESLRAPVVWEETGNPRTIGKRFDPQGLTDALLSSGGDVRLETPFPKTNEPLILATGGFPVRFAREHGLLVRSNPWSEGDGLDFGIERGAARSSGFDEFYGRAMPAPPAEIIESRFVELAQLYGSHALVLNELGEAFAPDPISWAETDLVQAIARQPGGRAWYIVDDETLDIAVRGRTVAEMIEAARGVGASVVAPAELGFELPHSYRYAVHVASAVTHTLGGLAVDERARVLREDDTVIDGLFAAGVDAGGIAVGGYASGLATALVLGLTAAEEVSRL